MEQIVKDIFERGPPWLGDSSFSAKDRIKSAGARWDAASKKWKAVDETTLLALIATGAWRPAGYDSAIADTLAKYVRARNAASDADALRKRAEAQKQQSEGKAVLDVRLELQIPADEPCLLEQLAAHGVDAALVTESGKWPLLGPRSGISDAARLLRGVRLNKVSFDQLASGEAAALAGAAWTTTSKPESMSAATSRTGRAREGKGVKRGHEGQRTTQAQLEEKEREAATQQPGPKNREAASVAAAPVEYTYTTTCGACGSVLDSRLQFGLDCGCEEFRLWSACERCFVPMEGPRGLCAGCA